MVYKGVISYNPITKKCIVSRHVIFYKMTFPYTQVSRQTLFQQLVASSTTSQFRSIIVPVLIPSQVPSHDNTIPQNEHMDPAFSLSQFSLHNEFSPSISHNTNASAFPVNQEMSN